MRKLSFIITILIFSFMPLLCQTEQLKKYYKPRFYIIVKGQLNSLKYADYQDLIDSNQVYFESLMESSSMYTLDTRESTPKNSYEVEIGIEAGKFSVGLSISQLKKEYDLDYLYQNPENGYSENIIWNRSLSVVPIIIINRLQIIDTKTISSWLTVGFGAYIGKYKDYKTQHFANTQQYSQILNIESNITSPGFHLGATININISRNLALTVEPIYRLANFRGKDGDKHAEIDGTINDVTGKMKYITEDATGEKSFWVGNFGSNFSGEKAKLGASGFTLNVGIKIVL